MTYTTTPVKFEIADDCDFLVATVTMEEAGLAAIEFHSQVTRGSWPEISAEVLKCLDAMFGYEDV